KTLECRSFWQIGGSALGPLWYFVTRDLRPRRARTGRGCSPFVRLWKGHTRESVFERFLLTGARRECLCGRRYRTDAPRGGGWCADCRPVWTNGVVAQWEPTCEGYLRGTKRYRLP